jgi:hypothetical protein
MPERRADAEAIDWASLEVHGPAEDVPMALHAIWSPDEDLRKLGYRHLSSRLTHGGSTSPASVAAVPFLVDVVADPAAPSRFLACQVLGEIAVGEEEIILDARTDFAYWRREAQRTADLTVVQLEAEQQAWVVAAADPEERSARAATAVFRDVEEEREAIRVNAEAYDAVRAGVPVYLAALLGADADTRMSAAQLLAYFPEDRSAIVPALLPLIAGPDPAVAAAAAVAAGICARGTGEPSTVAAVTARRQRAADQAGRWAMAIALAQLLDDPGADVIADVEAAAEKAPPLPRFPFLDGDIATVAAITLNRFEGDGTA